MQIYKTGNTYFGKIIWFKDPGDTCNKVSLDVNNPDKSKRKSALFGLVFLSGFKYDARHKKWWGKLYDYDGLEGKTLKSYLRFKQDGTPGTYRLHGQIMDGFKTYNCAQQAY